MIDVDFTEPGVNIHTDPDVNSAVVGQGSPGDVFRTGDNNGPTNWVYGTDLRTQVTGYVSGDYLTPTGRPVP